MTIKVRYTAEIQQPIEVVFRAATDLAELPRWSNVREVRRVSNHPLKVGTAFQLVTHLGSEDRLADCKVTLLDAPRRFVYVSESVGRSEINVDLQPIGDRTKLIYTVSITVAVLFEPLVRGEVDRQARSDLNRFLKLLEVAP